MTQAHTVLTQNLFGFTNLCNGQGDFLALPWATDAHERTFKTFTRRVGENALYAQEICAALGRQNGEDLDTLWGVVIPLERQMSLDEAIPFTRHLSLTTQHGLRTTPWKVGGCLDKHALFSQRPGLGVRRRATHLG